MPALGGPACVLAVCMWRSSPGCQRLPDISATHCTSCGCPSLLLLPALQALLKALQAPNFKEFTDKASAVVWLLLPHAQPCRWFCSRLRDPTAGVPAHCACPALLSTVGCYTCHPCSMHVATFSPACVATPALPANVQMYVLPPCVLAGAGRSSARLLTSTDAACPWEFRLCLDQPCSRRAACTASSSTTAVPLLPERGLP
jgi:hypothetical protein